MKTNLCITHDASFWPFISWADFSLMTDRPERVVIIPVVSMADWQLEAPLDFEECLTLSLLKSALEKATDAERFLAIPPVRFTMGRPGQSFFSVDAETAHATLEDIAKSIHSHGFRKVLFLNSSPWNEDLVDAGGRDLRISLGLQPFSINLSGLGFDFLANDCRDKLLLMRDHLFGAEQGSGESGRAVMEKSASELLALLEEAYAFRPLPDNGVIPQKKFPL